jgi:hypothetical protein
MRLIRAILVLSTVAFIVAMDSSSADVLEGNVLEDIKEALVPKESAKEGIMSEEAIPAEAKKADLKKESSHKGMALGEDAQAKAKFPGPFSPVKAESDGTAGYVTEINHYNNLDTTTDGIDCKGDAANGKAQTYTEEGEDAIPNLIQCRDKCNACKECAGWVDMLSEQKCYFMKKLEWKPVRVSDGLDIYKKYWNKVKSYEICGPGNSSDKEAPHGQADSCKNCTPGMYSDHSNMHERCTPCAPGKITNNVVGYGPTCTDCPKGKISNADLNACEDCPATYYSDVGQWECKLCPKGTYGNKKGRTGPNGKTGECLNCPEGKFSLEGSFSCKSCYGGQWSADRSHKCTDCIAGRYSKNEAGQCTKCADGRSANKGSASCYICKAGKFAESGWAACENCPRGNFSIAEQKTCPECTAGKFARKEGMPKCKSCPPG